MIQNTSVIRRSDVVGYPIKFARTDDEVFTQVRQPDLSNDFSATGYAVSDVSYISLGSNNSNSCTFSYYSNLPRGYTYVSQGVILPQFSGQFKLYGCSVEILSTVDRVGMTNWLTVTFSTLVQLTLQYDAKWDPGVSTLSGWIYLYNC